MGRARVALGGAGMIVAIGIGAGQAGPASGRLPGTPGTSRVPAVNAAFADRCQAGQLRIVPTLAQPGLSHHGYVLLFHNQGATCTLSGYPGVDALSAQGHVLVSARRTRSGYLGGLKPGHPIPKVRLARGKTASALLEWVMGLPSCLRPHSLKVTAPDAVRSVRLTPKSLGSQRFCHLQIHPVVAGVTGQES